MAGSVRITDDVMAAAHREAELHGRSVAEQIDHWIRLGRAIEGLRADDHARATAAPDGLADAMGPQGEAVITWLDAFTEEMSTPSVAELAFFNTRRQLGRGVGLDGDGNLVHAKLDKAAENQNTPLGRGVL